MDPWQIEHIRKNLPELLSLTKVSAKFIAVLQSLNSLSDEDVDRIKCVRPKLEKASRLYSIVQTRIHGYWDVLNALQKSNQSGAVQIFLKGVPKDLKSTKVEFLGKVCCLSELLPEKERKEVISQLETSLFIEENINLCKNSFTTVDPIKFVRLEIPRQRHLYIPRFLNRCVGVNPAVFTTEIEDHFVLKDFNTANLKRLNKPPEDISIEHSSKLLFNRQINVKLILLDHADDWKELKQRSEHPIHLIQYQKDEDEYVLLETSGGSRVIHEYLVKAKTDSQARIPENEVLKDSCDSRGICICDSPGMGKSMLLASLARNAVEVYPESIVGFLHLSDIADLLKNPQTFPWMETLVQLLASSKTAFILLNSILKVRNVNYELFFDALDEVEEELQNTVTHFLSNLLAMNRNIKIYITARRHVREELEKPLGVVAWDIEPLSRENQILFLVSFWSNHCHLSLKEKLHAFANMCVDRVEGMLDERERTISGIPLQCRLMAEVYAEDSRVFAHPGRNITEDPNVTFMSLPEMYKNLIELRLGKSECSLKCITSLSSNYKPCNKQCAVINIHIATAFEKVLPDFFKSEFYPVKNLGTINEGFVLEKGLLEKHGKDWCEFVHLTIAEFLVALYLANTLNYSQPSGIKRLVLANTLQLLFHKLLCRRMLKYENKEIRCTLANVDLGADVIYFTDLSKNIPELGEIKIGKEVVVYFLNYMLNPKNLAFGNASNLYSLVGYMSPRQLYNIILLTLQNNFLNTFALVWMYISNFGTFNRYRHKRFLTQNFVAASSKSNFPPVFCRRFPIILCMACNQENLSTFKTVVGLMKEKLHFDPIGSLMQVQSELDSFLLFVASYCDCDVLEYLFELVPNAFNKVFVSKCLINTMDLENNQIQRRINLLDFFDKNCIKICFETFQDLQRVHYKIVMHLLKFTAVSEDTFWDTAFFCAGYTPTEDFLDLCNFFLIEYKNLLGNTNLEQTYDEKFNYWKKSQVFQSRINDVDYKFRKLFEVHSKTFSF